jgi:hypothetical protein
MWQLTNLREIFVPFREEVTGNWGKLCNDDLVICSVHEFYSSEQF